MNRQTTVIDDLHVEYLDSQGDGPWVFLFHGNSSAADAYACLFESDLASRYRLIAVDFPGHKLSSLPDDISALSIPYLGRLTAKIVEHFEAEDYLLVGQSVGGHALMEAIDMHKSACGLMLVSSPPISLETLSEAFSPDPTDGLLFKQTLDDEEVERFAGAFLLHRAEENLEAISSHIRQTDGRFRQALGESIARGELIDEHRMLNQCRMPVAMLRGDQDAFLETEYYNGLDTTGLWQNKVIAVESCGHSIPVEKPGGFIALVDAFFESVAVETAEEVLA